MSQEDNKHPKDKLDKRRMDLEQVNITLRIQNTNKKRSGGRNSKMIDVLGLEEYSVCAGRNIMLLIACIIKLVSRG